MSRTEEDGMSSIDREEVSQLLTNLMDLATTIEDLGKDPDHDMLEISRSSTKRANLRTRPEHKAFAEKFRNGVGTNSRETLFGLALEFTRHNQEEFAEFLSKYVLHEMQGNLVPLEDPVEEISEIEHEDSTETEDSSPDDVDSTPEGGTDEPDEQEDPTESDESEVDTEQGWDANEQIGPPGAERNEQQNNTDW